MNHEDKVEFAKIIAKKTLVMELQKRNMEGNALTKQEALERWQELFTGLMQSTHWEQQVLEALEEEERTIDL